jgi:hypothetical protein
MFGQRLHNYGRDGNGLVSPSSEFHQRLIVLLRVEADGDAFGFVFIEEKHAPKQDSLGVESHTDRFFVEVARVQFGCSDEEVRFRFLSDVEVNPPLDCRERFLADMAVWTGRRVSVHRRFYTAETECGNDVIIVRLTKQIWLYDASSQRGTLRRIWS